MDKTHIPKDLLYGELSSGSHGVVHPQLHYKDVCKCDMKACDIDAISWTVTAENRTLWKWQVSHGLKQGEYAMHDAAMDKTARRKATHKNNEITSTESHDFMC